MLFLLHLLQQCVQLVDLALWERLALRHLADEHTQAPLIHAAKQITRLLRGCILAADGGIKDVFASLRVTAHRPLLHQPPQKRQRRRAVPAGLRRHRLRQLTPGLRRVVPELLHKLPFRLCQIDSVHRVALLLFTSVIIT